MSVLSKLPNIGEVLADKLEQAGIKNEKELKIMGSEKAFLLVKEVDPKACINHLYALEGAVQGIRWHSLAKDKKNELKEFFDLCK
jgi:DNA transformation protein and related proteins